MWENYFYTPWFSLLTYLLGLSGADVFFRSTKVMLRIYKSKYLLLGKTVNKSRSVDFIQLQIEFDFFCVEYCLF